MGGLFTGGGLGQAADAILHSLGVDSSCRYATISASATAMADFWVAAEYEHSYAALREYMHLLLSGILSCSSSAYGSTWGLSFNSTWELPYSSAEKGGGRQGVKGLPCGSICGQLNSTWKLPYNCTYRLPCDSTWELPCDGCCCCPVCHGRPANAANT